MAGKTRRRSRRVRGTRRFRKVTGGNRRYHNGGYPFQTDPASKIKNSLNSGVASIKDMTRRTWNNISNGAQKLGYKTKNALRIN